MPTVKNHPACGGANRLPGFVAALARYRASRCTPRLPGKPICRHQIDPIWSDSALNLRTIGMIPTYRNRGTALRSAWCMTARAIAAGAMLALAGCAAADGDLPSDTGPDSGQPTQQPAEIVLTPAAPVPAAPVPAAPVATDPVAAANREVAASTLVGLEGATLFPEPTPQFACIHVNV